MPAAPKNKPPLERRPPQGEVIGVSLTPNGEERPSRLATVECEGHAHRYEIAWHDTDSGPVLTDLRIYSSDGIPITRSSLRRINPDRILAAAYRADAPKQADTWHGFREIVEDAAQSLGMPRGGAEWIDGYRPTAAGLLAAAQRTGSFTSRKPGRPRLPPQHYERVAALAREGRNDGSQSIARYIAERTPYADGSLPAVETVNGWLKRCKKLGLLAPGDLRKPKRGSQTS